MDKQIGLVEYLIDNLLNSIHKIYFSKSGFKRKDKSPNTSLSELEKTLIINKIRGLQGELDTLTAMLEVKNAE